MMMTNKQKTQQILAYLDEIFPNVGCELNYSKDYELVIAVMLSAQTTDVSVNLVTAKLFDKYKTLESLAKAPLNDIEDIIHSIGLYKNKAKNLLGIANTLLDKYGVTGRAPPVPSVRRQRMTDRCFRPPGQLPRWVLRGSRCPLCHGASSWPM